MVSKPLACASWTILATLLAGCASETAAPPDAPGCTSVVAEGLTTDHASTGGASWSDYDGDGDLDLLVTNGYDVSSAEPSGQPNRLYRNEGGGAFTEITAGALAESAGFSSGSTWGDYDGDADLYVGNWPNEPGPGDLNALYRNESGGLWLRVRLEGGRRARGEGWRPEKRSRRCARSSRSRGSGDRATCRRTSGWAPRPGSCRSRCAGRRARSRG